jgi:hypothetical protein
MSRKRFSSLSYITSSFIFELIPLAAVNMPVEVILLSIYYIIRKYRRYYWPNYGKISRVSKERDTCQNSDPAKITLTNHNLIE